MDAEQLAELERTLPAIISRGAVARLTGGLISPGRLANLDSEGLGPRRLIVGRKAAYTRGDFLTWLASRGRVSPEPEAS